LQLYHSEQEHALQEHTSTLPPLHAGVLSLHIYNIAHHREDEHTAGPSKCKKQTSRAAEEPEQQLCTLQSNTKLQAGSGIAALQEGSKRGIGSLPSDEDELIFNFKRVTAQG
jgi:hypothetical protein